MLRLVYFDHFCMLNFQMLFLRYFFRAFSDFIAQRCPKVAILGSFLITFRGSGAYARTVLSLQRELDLEGWRGSENRRFFDVFFRSQKMKYCVGNFCRSGESCRRICRLPPLPRLALSTFLQQLSLGAARRPPDRLLAAPPPIPGRRRRRPRSICTNSRSTAQRPLC